MASLDHLKNQKFRNMIFHLKLLTNKNFGMIFKQIYINIVGEVKLVQKQIRRNNKKYNQKKLEYLMLLMQ